MSTLFVNQINPVSGNSLTLSGSNIVIPGNLTIVGSLSGSLTGSVTSASYALTASYALNSPGGGGTTDTGSLLLTASVTDNVITFTKGDASTFNITVNTGSASSINTGSFATTGSNQFSGSQGITGSLSVNSGTIINSDDFSIISVLPNSIIIEGQVQPSYNTSLFPGVLSYYSASNSQQLLFPVSLSTGIKTITLPNDTGTVALTYNTATTGSNIFTGNQIISGSALISGSVILSGSNAGVNSSTTVGYDKIELDNPTFGYGYNAKLYSSYLVFDDSNILQTYYSSNMSKTVGLNTQNINFPDNPTGGIKTIYFPNDTGTVALTYNTATTGSNIFSGSQTITGSLNNGLGNTITGLNSHAEGQLTVASGSYSHAEGYKSQAVGQYSHAEGGGPAGTFTEQLGGRATGTGSHAEGSFTLASGSFSHAEGNQTTASAPWSHAEGLGTIANGWYQHVQGAYNVPSSEQSAFIVGNGVADEVRSNLILASGELVQVTGSVSITSVLTLTPNDPLPSAQPTGSIAVSGSGVDCKPYFYNGTDWTSLI
jgi:hypothetical protein